MCSSRKLLKTLGNNKSTSGTSGEFFEFIPNTTKATPWRSSYSSLRRAPLNPVLVARL